MRTLLYIRVYNKNGAEVGDAIPLSGEDGSTNNTTISVTAGQEYYIKTWFSSYDGNPTGPYQIAINTKNIMVPTVAGTLVGGYWNSVGGHRFNKWFKFTATASTQRIYLQGNFEGNFSYQVFDSSGTPISGFTTLPSGSNLSSINVSLTIGQEYYIWTQPSGASITYSYNIKFD